MTLSRPAARVLRILQETGPRPLTMLAGLVNGSQAELQRLIGELFIAGVVKWESAKRWRRLAATTTKAP